MIVATHGRAFWILDDMTPLRELSASLAASDHLFTPAPVYRIQRDTYTDTPLPPDEPAAENPPDGAIIDYYLANASSAPVTLEILNANGKLVRKFSSDDKPPASESELKKQLIPLYWLRPFQALSAEAGMHRWVWGLHYPAPDSPRHSYPISAIPHDTPRYPLGPTVLPGSYTARLVVNGKSYSARFTVNMDPRVKISNVDLQKKFELETQLAALLRETSSPVMQVDALRKPLEKLSQQATGAALDAVKNFQNKLNEIAGQAAGFLAPPTEAVTLNRVNGQIAVLYGAVWQADAAPTMAQSEAATSVEHDAKQVMQRWEGLKISDLPTLNRALHDANLPEVNLEPHPHTEDSGMDEE